MRIQFQNHRFYITRRDTSIIPSVFELAKSRQLAARTKCQLGKEEFQNRSAVKSCKLADTGKVVHN